ncbi:patatin family protein [bacterium]|nr:patatin family protein [bacterium]MDC0338053.1 patatin family protein [Flavobacteriales bacterium]
MKKEHNIGLIVQGGSLRSVFSAGVLDAFNILEFNPFDYYAGVSGGAMSLSYFLSGQDRTLLTILKELSQDDQFINIKNVFSEEGFVNLEYLEKFTQDKYPLDVKSAMHNLKDKTFEIVATDMANGNPVYLQPTMRKWLLYLRASATLPFFSRGVCNVNGRQLMDGGWSDAIPVKRGIKKGAKKIVVIRTLPKDHKEDWSYFGIFGGFWHRNNPKLSKRFSDDHLYYNKLVDFLDKKHDGIDIYQLAPEKYLKTTSYASTLEKIEDDYRLGLETGMHFVSKNRELFE